MPMIYDEVRFSCRCGSPDVGSHNYEDEFEEPGLWQCGKCGYADYPDAFDRPSGFIDDECPTCKKETVHSILGIDNWSGEASFRCDTCKTEGEYEITAPREFKRRVGK